MEEKFITRKNIWKYLSKEYNIYCIIIVSNYIFLEIKFHISYSHLLYQYLYIDIYDNIWFNNI